jgi:hypothetical protein
MIEAISLSSLHVLIRNLSQKSFDKLYKLLKSSSILKSAESKRILISIFAYSALKSKHLLNKQIPYMIPKSSSEN